VTPAPLHPQVEALRRKWLAAGVHPIHELTVAAARDAERAEDRPEPEPVASAVDDTFPGPGGSIRVRSYLPEAASPLPVLVFFAGGGWVLGSLDGVDAVCRRLANQASCAVVSVDYRRAPENPFPAGLEDCYAATCWLEAHRGELGLDPTRMAVAGTSAGGNLATAIALLSRERGGPHLVFQLLVYPPLEHGARTQSMQESLPRPFFGPADIGWCWDHYLDEPADGQSPLASPLRATDLRGLPPTLIVTAELDPLRDEAELYAQRLSEAGVSTQLVRFEGMPHGFFGLTDDLDAAGEAQAIAASALRHAFEAALDAATV
jgi:acetyl esterase